MEQRQPTAEEQKQYKEAYDKFAGHYMGLNDWGKVDFLFQMKVQLDTVSQILAQKNSKPDLTIPKP